MALLRDEAQTTRTHAANQGDLWPRIRRGDRRPLPSTLPRVRRSMVRKVRAAMSMKRRHRMARSAGNISERTTRCHR